MRTQPKFTLDTIRFSTDQQTFERAVTLYDSGKVTKLEEDINVYSATVLGSRPYLVSVEARRYDYGDCSCYLGQHDKLCKHMVALAIAIVQGGEPLSDEQKVIQAYPTCSGHTGELSDVELKQTKFEITKALRYIKAYKGPSRTWFAYQDSLSEGCRRLTYIVSSLPISKQTAGLLVDLLLRLDRKLCEGGVDDSDGTVGGFIYDVVEVLKEFTQLEPVCIKMFKKITKRETCFEWEQELVRIFNESL